MELSLQKGFSRQQQQLLTVLEADGVLGDKALKELGFDPQIDLGRLAAATHRLNLKLPKNSQLVLTSKGSKKQNMNPAYILSDKE